MSPSRGPLIVLSVLALFLGAGATVGDVGSCGSTAVDLDPDAFANARKNVDCRRCTECGIDTETCRSACDANAPPTAGWPSTCHPLLHDGEVCLRALLAAHCSDYAAFVDDIAPTVPTECDFCRLAPESRSTAVP